MDKRTAPDLSADRPVSSLADDRLSRGDFVISLANALVTWTGNDSLVVALYGPWGCGKTSIKNMVLEAVRKDEAGPGLVEFNPWAWSGGDRLLPAFLREVGLAIETDAKSADGKELAQRWKRYAAKLTLGGSVLGYLGTATSVLGVPLAPLAFGLAAGAANGVAGLAGSAAAAHEAEAVTPEETLEAVKRAVSDALAGLKTPILVVMDDVDRLTQAEVRLLFQLIKANADFPKTVYLLLFDRAVVEKALDGATGVSGREYMKKIVQVGFDVPRVPDRTVHDLLTAGLSRLLDGEAMERTFNEDHWGRVFMDGLRPFFETLRDVNRFLSSFSFTLLLFLKDGTLEVNPIDLIAVETLRLFEPDLYKAMPTYKPLLTGTDRSYTDRDDRADRRAQLDLLLAHASEPRRQTVKQMLSHVFPQIGWLVQNMMRGPSFESYWLTQLRVCYEALFDRYFHLAVPKGDVPMSAIYSLLAATNDRSATRHAMEAMLVKDQITQVLGRLGAFTERLDEASRTNLVTAIYDVGDRLPEGEPGLLNFGPFTTASFTVYGIMRQVQDVADRGRIVAAAMTASEGLYVPLRQVGVEGQRETQERTSIPSDDLMDDETLAAMRRLCVEKIRTATAAGRDFGQNLQGVLRDWQEWDGPDGPGAYATTLATTVEGSMRLATGFLYQVRMQVTGSYSLHSRWLISLSALARFVDVDRLRDVLRPRLGAASATPDDPLPVDHARVIEALRTAYDRRDRGLPEDTGRG